MRVVQSCHGKFHHFDLARQLHQRGALECLFTGYPRWKLRHEQLPASKVRTLPWLPTLYLARGRLGLTQPWLERELACCVRHSHDWLVRRSLPDCDVFVGISGVSLTSGRRAQTRGAKYICDRGSAHIAVHDRLLREEFAKRKVPYVGTDPRDRAQEEAEYAAADLITVPSSFAQRTFVSEGVPVSRVRRVAYGMDLARFQRVGQPPTDKFVVLFVGAISFNKGIPYLLEAFATLRHPRKELVLVGVMAPEMTVFCQGKQFPHVTFVGHQPQAELPRLMSTSHVLVLPSLSDGFGLVMGQAMACGCPVIASENSGGPDLIAPGVSGFVIPAGQSEPLRERLQQLADDAPLQRALAEGAFASARSLGGWDTYGREYFTLCQQLSHSHAADS
ncbi:MAG: glycosyltransferase family 1 protein [Verrucomicrobia bacterium]|nr:glycosyltransferase family 1 protein [Verrucomicrobiota bacterium]NBU07644.1 glycosyltransferase family 1 protein [Pseudomonadota bacterium]NDA65144.1 glycosyltransferase family 1 protein [Verrucomicrobiota bacterium]NDB74191.1 glycosyltransferase family 1 protein [Verrucomicrobiota bacterium]NDD37223.1 glycosyltransferase family 1 protein [Verrucomicrobiota bacterium]